MLELELQQYLLREYPQENARCEWKEFKNLKNSFCGDEKDDVISYVSAIANMEGGHLVIGVKDKTLEIVGTDISRMTFNGQPANTQSATFKLTEQCTYLSSEGLSIEEFVTDDTNKRVWINDTLSLWDCISLDAVQKGRTIHEDVAQDLLRRGLIEGEPPHYSISLSVAKNTHQLPSYTKTKGLDKAKLRQMVLQYLSNAGEEGAKRDSIYEYLKDVLPQNKTEEQKLRGLGDLLKTMKKEDLIWTDGRNWFEK